MAIVETVNEWMFIKAFDDMNRSENFSRPARRALFEHLSDVSEDIGENIELDVIAICCEWSEYSQDELINQYGHFIEGDKDSDEYIDELISELHDHTTVVQVHADSYLIQEF